MKRSGTVGGGYGLAVGCLWSPDCHRRSGTTEIVLKDGRVLHGRTGETTSLAERSGVGRSRRPQADRLHQRRVPPDLRLPPADCRGQVRCARWKMPRSSSASSPRTAIGQNGRQKVISVGPPAGPLKEFDEWGRRIYPMLTARRHTARRSGHYPPHAAIRPGRGIAG